MIVLIFNAARGPSSHGQFLISISFVTLEYCIDQDPRITHGSPAFQGVCVKGKAASTCS